MNRFFKKRFIAQIIYTASTRENYRIVPVTSLNKYLQYGASGTPCEVGPCHHGMARPQVADGGTASDKEGSCE
jgi:hypothetical protein